MLKQYAIEDLKAGMVVGSPVYDENANILIGKGQKLTNASIFSLLERPIFSICILESDEEEKEAEKETADAGLESSPKEAEVQAAEPPEGPAVSKPESRIPASMATPEVNAALEKVRQAKPVTQEEKKVLVGKEHLLDDHYVACYTAVFEELRNIFERTRRIAEVDTESLGNLVASGQLLELCDSSMAVSQIHNMVRDGDYLLHHSIHVAILAGLMGKWLHMPRTERQKLMLAGLLHDVGKLRISKDILDKAGRLTATELRVVKRHAALGFEMLRYGQMREEQAILAGVLQHHERCDGSGYPEGLHKADIGTFGRILAVLDIYDAMAANRSYARRKSPFDIFTVLADDLVNKRLDPEYGVLFIRKVSHSLNGSWVRLSNGQKAKIVYLDESRMRALPIVQTEDNAFIDLNTAPKLRITDLLTYHEIMDD